jgi:hypothetical protein
VASTPDTSLGPDGGARRDAARIRLGILCLLASGVFSAIGLPLRGPIVLPGEDPQRWAEVALLPTHDLAWAILLPSLVIQLFGFLALWAYVRDTREDALAFWGMVLSIAGNGLFLPSTGILAFSDPRVAPLVQAGVPGALEVATSGVSGALSGAILAGSGLLLLAGSVLVSLVLWRSPRLPRWTAVPYLLHALALTIVAPQSYLLERAGGVLLLVVAGAITLRVWRGTAAAPAGRAGGATAGSAR